MNAQPTGEHKKQQPHQLVNQVANESFGRSNAPSPIAGELEVIAPHFKRRLSGITSTVIQLIPQQRKLGLNIATLGPGLPKDLPRISWWSLVKLWRKPATATARVWHARRNVEMAGGLFLRDVLRMPLRLVFTSAAQRHHQPLTRWMIARMDRVIATSERSGSYLHVAYKVIRHGIDVQAFKPADPANEPPLDTEMAGYHLIGCTGRVRAQKGTDLFVQAMIDLLPRYPNWMAVITGRVTPENREFADGLQQRIRAAGLEDRIRFLGEVEDIKPWYRRMTLFVAPSRNEGFGLTPLEAMASGVAVVASDAGAYGEMIKPGQTGAIVPAGDQAALTHAIGDYLENPALASEQGQRGVDHVSKYFPLEREARELNKVYRSLAGGAHGAPARREAQ